jgi:hypothetical protein
MFKNPFNYNTKVYPEKILINNTEFSFGFMFIERKRRQRFLKLKKLRSATVELDNTEFNFI